MCARRASSTSIDPEPRSEAAIVIACAGDRALVRERPASDPLLAGLLEFPGGRRRPGEEPRATAARELLEETGLRASDLTHLITLDHDYPGRKLTLHFFLWCIDSDPPDEVAGWSWVPIRELTLARMPGANREAIEKLHATRNR